MKINAISNTNFRGLFTDKSAQNGGNWKMEYSPYAWESKQGWVIDSKMANQSDIDVFGTCLPDNEKIYTEKNGRKSAKDILGTEFYYEYQDGKVRKTITEVPAMNREESLRVYNGKLQKFLGMKEEKAESIKKTVSDSVKKLENEPADFYERAREIKKTYLQRTHTLEDSSDVMMEGLYKVKNTARNIAKQFENYIMYIASREGNSYFTKMKLSAFRIYNRELTQKEIKNNYEIDRKRFE